MSMTKIALQILMKRAAWSAEESERKRRGEEAGIAFSEKNWSPGARKQLDEAIEARKKALEARGETYYRGTDNENRYNDAIASGELAPDSALLDHMRFRDKENAKYIAEEIKQKLEDAKYKALEDMKREREEEFEFGPGQTVYVKKPSFMNTVTWPGIIRT